MIKKVLIIINTSKDESKSLAKDIAEFLEDKGYVIAFFDFDGFCPNITIKDYSFVVTLGGDGTVLYAARNCVQNEIPVFPVNLGQFGFMAPIQQNEWKKALEEFLNGNSPSQERCLISVKVERENKILTEAIALNDLVISAKDTTRTLALIVKYNDVHLCKLKADGVIISTPTGSTAYSASSGGPIVDPLLDAIVMTPLNSFSLSSRPIVLNPDGVIKIYVQPGRTKDSCLVIDGQEPVSLVAEDCIEIRKLQKKIKLIGCTEEKFFNALRSKLNWRGEPYA